MSSDKKKILLVDDAPDDIRFLMENLKQYYAVLVATEAKKALDIVSQDPKPEVILMDVSMPGMNGYELCEKLKSDPSTQDIDVIFVTANDTVDEKLKGYEVGGSDYLIKPVVPDELIKKVDVVIKNSIERRKISQAAKSASDVAMTAIKDAGELAVVIEFLRESFKVSSIEELAQLMVDKMAKYDLASSAQIRAPWEIINAGTVNPIPPLEAELMFKLKDDARVNTFGKRLLLNYGQVTLLIKNLPDDEAKVGRLRDHLALVVEGASERYKTLAISQELEAILSDSMSALDNIQYGLAEQKSQFVAIMDKVRLDVQASFLSYGLTDDQENLLVDIVNRAEDETLQTLEKGQAVDDEFATIVNRLKAFSNRD